MTIKSRNYSFFSNSILYLCKSEVNLVPSNFDLYLTFFKNNAISEAFLMDLFFNNLFRVDNAILFILIVGHELIRTLNFFDRNFFIRFRHLFSNNLQTFALKNVFCRFSEMSARMNR